MRLFSHRVTLSVPLSGDEALEVNHHQKGNQIMEVRNQERVCTTEKPKVHSVPLVH